MVESVFRGTNEGRTGGYRDEMWYDGDPSENNCDAQLTLTVEATYVAL